MVIVRMVVAMAVQVTMIVLILMVIRVVEFLLLGYLQKSGSQQVPFSVYETAVLRGLHVAHLLLLSVVNALVSFQVVSSSALSSS